MGDPASGPLAPEVRIANLDRRKSSLSAASRWDKHVAVFGACSGALVNRTTRPVHARTRWVTTDPSTRANTVIHVTRRLNQHPNRMPRLEVGALDSEPAR
jgi:hypothetical protein